MQGGTWGLARQSALQDGRNEQSRARKEQKGTEVERREEVDSTEALQTDAWLRLQSPGFRPRTTCKDSASEQIKGRGQKEK